MSRVRADRLTNKAGTGAPTLPNGVVVTGVCTATSFSGAATGLTGNFAGNAGGLQGTPDVTVGALNATSAVISADGQVGGALTVTGYAYFGSNVDIAGDLTYDELNARNINVSGVGTIASLFHVGAAATMMIAQGIGNSTRVGISSAEPKFVLDVLGDINSDRSIKIAGVDILTSASGDATALAIALG